MTSSIDYKGLGSSTSTASSEIDGRLPMLDGMRGSAALFVFLYHIWGFSNRPKLVIGGDTISVDLLGLISQGASGVDLFMILSGLCLFLPLMKAPRKIERWNMKNFFERRAWRLMPGYYASMIYVVALPLFIACILKLLYMKASWPTIPGPWHWITHIFFIHTFFESTWASINGPLWSLGIEAQLYLAFPIFLWAYKRWNKKIFPAIMCCCIAYHMVALALLQRQLISNIWTVNLMGRWLEFGCGMYIAFGMANWSTAIRESKFMRLAWLAAPFGFALAALSDLAPTLPLTLIGMTIGYGLIVMCGSCSSGIVHKFFCNRALVWLGGISYSFYLVHQSTAWYIRTFFERIAHMQGLTLFLMLSTVGLAAVIAISYLFYLCFEKPFLTCGKVEKSSRMSIESSTT